MDGIRTYVSMTSVQTQNSVFTDGGEYQDHARVPV